MNVKRILAATDFSDLASAAVRHAAGLARDSGAELIILYADPFEPPAEFMSSQVDTIARDLERSQERALEELRRYAAEHVGDTVKWRAVVAVGTPAAAIVKAAEEEGVDLIAMGTHGRSGLQRLILGSVAERVMREAPVPVLTVRKAA
ncbi:MAG TPA: universal stress protein [Thermoanaerobaculia bacterium]|nr:universal stress protein [Thermoanaerobaculia bacterium]